MDPHHSESPPVFITGVPRSGTTFLFHCIARHSQFRVAALAERVGVESKVFSSIEVLASGELTDSMQRFLLYEEEEVQQLLASVAEIRLGSEFAYRLTRRIPTLRPLAWKRRGLDRVAREFFLFATKAREVRRMLEKTPDHSRFLPEIWATFPDAPVLFAFRHPVSVYCSYRNRLEFDKKSGRSGRGTRWMDISPSAFAESYESRLVEALEFGKNRKNRFMTVRYESLMTEPSETLEQICRFIGERSEVEQMLGRAEGGGGRATREASPSALRWQDFMALDEAKEIEDLLEPRLAQLGFERFTE